MPQRRVTLKPDAYKALQAEALIRSMSLSDLLDELIMGHISKEAKIILEQLPSSTSAQISKQAKKKSDFKEKIRSSLKTRSQLSKDPDRMAQLLKLWAETDLNQTQIAHEIGSPESTVRALIGRLRHNGELPPRRESGSVSEPEV